MARQTRGAKDSSGRGTSPSQRPLPDNTQQSQETDIHNAGGIRTHNPSKRAAVDPRLRPRGHWDRQTSTIPLRNPPKLINVESVTRQTDTQVAHMVLTKELCPVRPQRWHPVSFWRQNSSPDAVLPTSFSALQPV
jgi:hypothetical protein